MFLVLFSLALDAKIGFVNPTNENAAFELTYTDTNGQKSNLTTNGEGFFIAIRPYDENGKPSDDNIRLLTYHNDLYVEDEFSLVARTEQGLDKLSYEVSLYVNNYKPTTFRYDLGVFADVNFLGDDNATLRFGKEGRSIVCESKGIYHQVIARGTNFADANTMYIGELANSQNRDPKSYPYWLNSSTPTKPTQDSVYAFAWQNRSIAAEEDDVVGFILAPSLHVKTQPFIHDITEKRRQYPNDFPIRIQVSEYNKEKVTVAVQINFGNEPTTYEFESDGDNNVSRVYEFRTSFTDGNPYFYISVTATDEEGYYSEYKRLIVGEGADDPILEINEDSEPAGEYNPTDKISLKGYIDDEKYVVLRYQFDEGPIRNVSRFDTSEEGKLEFSVEIDIPTSLEQGVTHTFVVWAEDEHSLVSEYKYYDFLLIKPTYPTIYSAYTSDERVKVGDEIVLYGEASDPDVQVIDVWATFEEETGKIIGNFTSNRKIYPWAFFYTVPEVRKGKYSIKMHVVDSDHQRSSNVSRVHVRVFDPNDPDPPLPPAKIIDVSSTTIKAGSNATFNLNYQDEENIKRLMSFKDEGFFSAFRLYDESFGLLPDKEIHLLKYTEGQQATARNVTVKFSTKIDEHTKYMHLVWEVTNDGYFKQYMDLGMFVDSDLAGDDNSGLWYRRDGRGFIVTSHDPVIHYTILTHGMYPYPDVSYTYLKDIPREGDSPIPVDKMPFFKKGDGSAYKGNNSMYALSWKRRTLLPGVTQTYGVVIAPHYDLKTPTRIIDNTQKYSWIEPNTNITLDFKFLDSDEGEEIAYIVSVNGSEEDHTFNATKEGHSYNKTVNVGNGPYFYYQVQAKDTEIFFPSNFIDVRIPISKPPRLTLNKQYLKNKYFTDSKIRLAGTVTDEKSVNIMYSIGGGRALQAAYVDIERTTKFDTEVPIPSGLKTGDIDWELHVWAEDNWGIRMLEDDIVKSFRLSERNPPNLTKAGLSSRVARPGEQVLGFAVIDDKEVGRYLFVDIKLGKGDFKETYRIQKYSSGRKPVAFYYKLPSDVQTGSYDVTFRLRDDDDLESVYTSKNTLIVTD